MNVRPSPLAGKWYPRGAEALAKTVDAFLDSGSGTPASGRVLGVLAPHAGHRYSGGVAGEAFAKLAGSTPDLVVVVGPSHYRQDEPLLACGHDAFATPLGNVPVDRAAVGKLDAKLRDQLGCGLAPMLNDSEHSIEIELPFLQRALRGKEFSILPIVMMDQSEQTSRVLGVALAEVAAERNTFFVASSDLSHFYEQSEAEKLDHEMLKRVESFDPEGVLRAEEQKVGFACGRGAIAATLWAMQDLGAHEANLLAYSTSGKVSGDFESVVGYGAAAFVA